MLEKFLNPLINFFNKLNGWQRIYTVFVVFILFPCMFMSDNFFPPLIVALVTYAFGYSLGWIYRGFKRK
jgi:hypothetical protein